MNSEQNRLKVSHQKITKIHTFQTIRILHLVRTTLYKIETTPKQNPPRKFLKQKFYFKRGSKIIRRFLISKYVLIKRRKDNI